MMDIFAHDGKSLIKFKKMQRELGIESGFYANISSKIREVFLLVCKDPL